MLIKKYLTNGLFFDADGGAGGAAAGNADTKLTSFDAWIEKQPEEVKTLYQVHTHGLTSALEKERQANKETKDSLKRLADLEAKEKEREAAALSETEKLTQRAATAEQERDAAIAEREQARTALQTERIKNAVIAEASLLGFADPNDAYTMITLSEIEMDETGKVKGAAEAIKKLAEAKPYLLGQATRKGDGVGTPKPGPQKKAEPSNQKRAPIIRSL